MADETGVKVSQLPLGENLADDDLMYAVENGVSKKVEVSYLQNRIVGDVDSTPTADSGNLVTSGGVYNMVHTLDFNVFHDLAQISNSIADAFSASESYSEGDYVVYDYSLYKFTADKSAGAWDSSKATPVAVVEELGSGGTTVVPNPSGEATDTLKKLKIDQTIYDFAASNVYGEASGAIASFADGSANPLKSLVVDINPVQAGSGTPAPDNVRPISGWSSVEVTVADDTTDPTTEETYEITLGQTVYGGKLNVTTGELTVDWVNVIYDGTENITLSSYHFFTLPIPKEHSTNTSVDRCICSLAKFNPTSTEYPMISTGNVASVYWLWIDPSSELYDNLPALKAWVAQMYANGTPLQLCYKTTEPTTIQLTPTQVSSLLGNNNIWADSGDVDVVYIRDLNLFLTQLDARVKALENA